MKILAPLKTFMTRHLPFDSTGRAIYRYDMRAKILFLPADFNVLAEIDGISNGRKGSSITVFQMVAGNICSVVKMGRARTALR